MAAADMEGTALNKGDVVDLRGTVVDARKDFLRVRWHGPPHDYVDFIRPAVVRKVVDDA